MTTLAGDGRAVDARGTATDRLSSPWDVAWWQRPGVDRDGRRPPAVDVRPGRPATVEVAAGTANEGLLDGPLAKAWFAQTSGLAVDGDRLWLADSETSSLRYVEDGAVHTVVGTGLFDFGFRDGPADAGAAAASARGRRAPRRIDRDRGHLQRRRPPLRPATARSPPLASDLAEPSGLYVDGRDLVVVESAAHRLTRMPLDARVARRRLQPHARSARSPRSPPTWSSTWRSPRRRAEGRRPVRPVVAAARRRPRRRR